MLCAGLDNYSFNRMKVKSNILHYMHLDREYSLLSGRNAVIVYQYFCLLDIHNSGALNDVQFLVFMKKATDLKKAEVKKNFKLLTISLCEMRLKFSELSSF